MIVKLKYLTLFALISCASLDLSSAQALPQEQLAKAPSAETLLIDDLLAMGPLGPGPERGAPCPFGGKLFEDLSLTDSQMEKLAELKIQVRTELMPLMARSMQLNHDLIKALSVDSLNTKEIERISEEKSSLHAQLDKVRSKELSKAAIILTPEQRSKMYKKMLQKELRFGPPPPFMIPGPFPMHGPIPGGPPPFPPGAFHGRQSHPSTDKQSQKANHSGSISTESFNI